MKIDGLGRVQGSQAAKSAKAGSSGKGEFSKLVEGSSARSNVAGSGSIGIEALLAVQEAGDATQGRSRGRARAEALLDSLEELRADLLSGSVSPQRLRSISQLVSDERDRVADPQLAGILDEIDLRAQVELAKLLPGPA